MTLSILGVLACLLSTATAESAAAVSASGTIVAVGADDGTVSVKQNKRKADFTVEYTFGNNTNITVKQAAAKSNESESG